MFGRSRGKVLECRRDCREDRHGRLLGGGVVGGIGVAGFGINREVGRGRIVCRLERVWRF